VTIEKAGGRTTVVVRRYVIASLNAEEPDLAAREARALDLLVRANIATPRLLAVDPTGDVAGSPTVVMSRVPGRLDWSPSDMDPWLRRLAEVLPRIHSAPITLDDGVAPFAPYAPDSWEPPEWLGDQRLWSRALEVFHGPCLDLERVFIHRDFHPGNVLWRRGRVGGIVDWQGACIGPRAADVWHCRANLLGRFGLDVADRFLELWEDITGERYHPWAEAVMLVDAIGWMHARGDRLRHDLEALLAKRVAELGG
jgi:aminoglycoside phosphotransferase (APT) family kinase protein